MAAVCVRWSRGEGMIGAVREGADSRLQGGGVNILLRVSYFSVFIASYVSAFYLPAKYFKAHFL